MFCSWRDLTITPQPLPAIPCRPVTLRRGFHQRGSVAGSSSSIAPGTLPQLRLIKPEPHVRVIFGGLPKSKRREPWRFTAPVPRCASVIGAVPTCGDENKRVREPCHPLLMSGSR